MIKHVGKHGDRKVLVLYRQVPGEDHMCLVIYPDTLHAHWQDSIQKALESDIAQQSEELADALHRTFLPDGRPILETLHQERMIKKLRTADVIVTPTPTATPGETPTPTPTVTQTQTNTPSTTPDITPTTTNTPSVTATPTSSPIALSGYGYNLIVLPYNFPTSGNTIFPQFNVGGGSGTTNPNSFALGGVYWNKIDNIGVNRTDYYSGITGNSVTVSFTQNGVSAIYSGISTAFIFEGPPSQDGFNYNPNTRPGQLTLIQSAATNFVTGQTVFITYSKI